MFHSEELNQLTDSLFGKVKNFNEHLNQVSEDIKNLEARLGEAGLGMAIEIHIGESYDLLDEEFQRLRSDKVKVASGDLEDVYADEFLCWKRDESSGKFRLIYSRKLTDDVFSEVDYSVYDMDRPLIECPVQIRLRAYKKLPKLVKKLDKLF